MSNQGRAAKHTIRDWCLSLGSLTVLVLALMAINGSVRARVTERLSTKPSTAFSQMGEQTNHLMALTVAFVKDQTLDHAPLVTFSVVAVVLLIVMWRS